MKAAAWEALRPGVHAAGFDVTVLGDPYEERILFTVAPRQAGRTGGPATESGS